MLKSIATAITIIVLVFGSGIASEIHEACEAGDIDQVKKLLSNNKELLNTPDDRGSMPLHIAVINGHDELVKLLIEQGADLNAVNGRGNNMVALAAYDGNLTMLHGTLHWMLTIKCVM